jgi:hypothetical protein
MAISHFLIIWSANLPEEITWYLQRMHGGWEWLGLALILFYFTLPFLLLLSRGIKQRAQLLAWVATGILVMHLVDLFWLVVPRSSRQNFRPLDGRRGLDGDRGIWIVVFVWQLRRRSLLPVHDPGLQGATPHG